MPDPTSPPVELLSVEEVAEQAEKWGHAVGCRWCIQCGRTSDCNWCRDAIRKPCACGLDAHRTFLATLSEALEHGQVVVDAGGIRGVLERVGQVDKPSPTDTFWQAEGDEIQHPTTYLDLATEQDDISLPDDPGWYDPIYRITPLPEDPHA